MGDLSSYIAELLVLLAVGLVRDFKLHGVMVYWQARNENWDAIMDVAGGLDKYLTSMCQRSTWADGVTIAAAVDLFQRSIVILQ